MLLSIEPSTSDPSVLSSHLGLASQGVTDRLPQLRFIHVHRLSSVNNAPYCCCPAAVISSADCVQLRVQFFVIIAIFHSSCDAECRLKCAWLTRASRCPAASENARPAGSCRGRVSLLERVTQRVLTYYITYVYTWLYMTIMYTYMYTYVYIYISKLCIYIHICTCVCVYAYIYI